MALHTSGSGLIFQFLPQKGARFRSIPCLLSSVVSESELGSTQPIVITVASNLILNKPFPQSLTMISCQEYVVESLEENKNRPELDPSHVMELRMLGLY